MGRLKIREGNCYKRMNKQEIKWLPIREFAEKNKVTKAILYGRIATNKMEKDVDYRIVEKILEGKEINEEYKV